MDEDWKDDYDWMDEDELREILENESETLSQEQIEYIKDLIEEEQKKAEKKKGQLESFKKNDNIPVDNNVAIVFDLDETLISRTFNLETNELLYMIARPGLFELLDSLKEMKEKYQKDSPTKEFNIYVFTSGDYKTFKNFIGEEYCSLFKDFINRESQFYDTSDSGAKTIHLLPEDTILYFADEGDASSAFSYSSGKAKEGQRLICFDITPFKQDSLNKAFLYREYTRHLNNKIQDMINSNDPNAVEYKALLDEISIKLLDYFDNIKKSDRIDTLIKTISTQLQGRNEDILQETDGISASKLIEIPSISNYKDELNEAYLSLFKKIYGEKAEEKMSDIRKSIPFFSAITDDIKRIESEENRAKYHPSEVYPHSRRFRNNDIGEIE